MDFIDLVKQRKTTYEFSDKGLDIKKIYKILDAGRWSPSCINSQPWKFIVIQNKLKINQLMSCANYGEFHSNPQIIIAIILRSKLCRGKDHSCYRGKDSGVHDSYMSCGIAVYAMALEATDIGVDSCILTPKQKEVKKILHVNKEDAVPLLLGLGYESKNAFQKRRERKSLKEIVCYEEFK